MRKYAVNEITFMQYILLNSGMQISIGFLSLPRVMAEKTGTDGWIALIIGWAISIMASLIIVQVMKKQPEGTLLDLLARYLGKWAGRTGAILFGLYFFYFSYACLVYTVLILQEWLLPQTPAYTIMILLLIPTYIIVRNGPRILGRYAELVILISLWIPFVYLLLLKNVHWLYMLPVLKDGWNPIFSAVSTTFYYFISFATTFILYPFLQNKQKASYGLIISNTLTLLMYLFIISICFIYFSPDEITRYNEPTISILKTIEFKFVERIEVLFIVLYMFIFSMSWIFTLYMSVFCTSWLLGKQDHRSHLRLVWLFIAAGTYFFMPTFNQSDRMNILLGQIGFGMEYVFPVCLLVYLWFHDHFQWRKSS